jgi:PadR family transcriptional regulator PadR
LEKKGLLRSYWVENEETGRRKFYSLTNEGKAELQEKLRSWNQINLLIQACRKVEFA